MGWGESPGNFLKSCILLLFKDVLTVGFRVWGERAVRVHVSGHFLATCCINRVLGASFYLVGSWVSVVFLSGENTKDGKCWFCCQGNRKLSLAPRFLPGFPCGRAPVLLLHGVL